MPPPISASDSTSLGQFAKQHLVRAIEQAAEAVVITSLDGIIQYVNPAFTTITGYPAAEVLGRTPRILSSGLHPPSFYSNLWRTVLAGNTWRGEIVNRRKDGSQYVEEMTITPVRGDSGELASFIAIKQDVTRRNAAEEASRFLASIVESTSDAIIGGSSAGIIHSWNRGAEELFGAPASDMLGRHVARLVPPARHAELAGIFSRLLAGLPTRLSETVAQRNDGTLLDVALTASPIFDWTGKVTGAAAIVRDITAEKAARRALDERAVLTALGAEIGLILSTAHSLQQGLQLCAAAFVAHTGAAFARVWTLDPSGSTLELQASAGLYTRLDGSHSRIRVGDYKIGRIAARRKPHLSENLLDDPEIGDPAWAAREGLTAFAGYPLVIDDRLVGVVAAFKCAPFGDSAIQAFASVSVQLAQFVLRKHAENEMAASLREKEALLREIHHRVKNNLQIVCSLLKLNSRQIADPAQRAVFDDMQHRVKSMALVHEVLYRSDNLAGIDFSLYTRRLAGHLLASLGFDPGCVNLNLHVESVVLPIDVAIPCALILTELITNSAKHALSPGRPGTLSISFCQPEPSRWTLRVEDSGSEPSIHQSDSGFGLELVRLLTEQLRGTLDLRRSPGFSTTISFPGWEPRAQPSASH